MVQTGRLNTVFNNLSGHHNQNLSFKSWFDGSTFSNVWIGCFSLFYIIIVTCKLNTFKFWKKQAIWRRHPRLWTFVTDIFHYSLTEEWIIWDQWIIQLWKETFSWSPNYNILFKPADWGPFLHGSSMTSTINTVNLDICSSCLWIDAFIDIVKVWQYIMLTPGKLATLTEMSFQD